VPEVLEDMPEKKKGKKTVLIIVIVAVALLLCCCLILGVIGFIPMIDGNGYYGF
jgi:flagellar basal body-associated protein FliL